jgi:hypothetical protein
MSYTIGLYAAARALCGIIVQGGVLPVRAADKSAFVSAGTRHPFEKEVPGLCRGTVLLPHTHNHKLGHV